MNPCHMIKSSVKYDFKKPINPNNSAQILTFLNKAKEYILSLQFYNKTKRVIRQRIIINISKKSILECKSKTGFLGFLICIQSLKHLFTTYVTAATITGRTPAYRLSQDHIEKILVLSGDKVVIIIILTHYNLKECTKKNFNHLELRSAFSGNCIPMEYINAHHHVSKILTHRQDFVL
ncbi:unnamed protein product [Euphydryas editha]|uniref:Uncharacterized protein n=1 Tax=Euphydryas editha TaxID=104508 RepID=A0AAU9TSN0_EUPED|nr:unnamed protein product [Euphydryas editha]